MIWQLHQGLFVQDQQHHSTPSLLYFTPNEPWPSASTLSSRPSSHWPASSQCGIIQVVSTLSQNSAQLETSAQTNNCSLKSSIPNLTFESSSSQTRPSPFGSTKATGEKNRPLAKSRGTPKSLSLESYTNVQYNA